MTTLSMNFKLIAIVIGFILLSSCESRERDETQNPGRAVVQDEQLLTVQNRFYYLALCIDRARWEGGLQEPPVPDWELRGQGDDLERAYTHVIYEMWNMDKRDPALAQRLLQGMNCYHYDLLAAYPIENEVFTVEVLRDLRNGEMQSDPFAPNCYLGYASTTEDFILVSVGPDGVSDVLGFVHFIDNGYATEADPEVTEMEDIRRLATRLSPSSRDDPQRLEILIDSIYDPTNGVFSKGDIVFQKKMGDNYMFSYSAPRMLNKSNFIKKTIDN